MELNKSLEYDMPLNKKKQAKLYFYIHCISNKNNILILYMKYYQPLLFNILKFSHEV